MDRPKFGEKWFGSVVQRSTYLFASGWVCVCVSQGMGAGNVAEIGGREGEGTLRVGCILVCDIRLYDGMGFPFLDASGVMCNESEVVILFYLSIVLRSGDAVVVPVGLVS